MKTKFSREKHSETGATLGRVRNELSALLNEVSAAYGSSGKASKEARKALEAVNHLRSALDNELAHETTRDEWEAEHLTRVYFSTDAKVEGT